MKSFKKYILLEANVKRFLKKNKNLTDDQIDVIADYFKKVNIEFDWQSKDVKKMTYKDFEKIMADTSYGIQKTLKVDVKGTEGKDYVHIKLKNKKYVANIPLNQITAEFMNSCGYGLINVNYCIGDIVNYSKIYWNKYIIEQQKIPIYIVDGKKKWVVMIHDDNKTYEVWDKLNNNDLALSNKEPIPDFSIKKKLLNSRIINLYDSIRKEFYKFEIPDWFKKAKISNDAEYSVDGNGRVHFSKGTFEGYFLFGFFTDATFINGHFQGKTFNNSTFENGVFRGEQFFNSTWIKGRWEGRKWIRGKDKNGILHRFPPDQWMVENDLINLEKNGIELKNKKSIKDLFNKRNTDIEMLIRYIKDKIIKPQSGTLIKIFYDEKRDLIVLNKAIISFGFEINRIYFQNCDITKLYPSENDVYWFSRCKMYTSKIYIDSSDKLINSELNDCSIEIKVNDIDLSNNNYFDECNFYGSNNTDLTLYNVKNSFFVDLEIQLNKAYECNFIYCFLNPKYQTLYNLYEKCTFDNDSCEIQESKLLDVKFEDCNITPEQLLIKGT